MIIDILVIICAIWALVIGLRRGFLVQLCHFIGLYLAVLLAPKYALEVGMIIFDEPSKAYITGFALIVICAILLVWIIAPLLRYVAIWKPIRPLDALLGGALNLATMIIVSSALFSVFDRMNLGEEIRQEKLLELMKEYEGREEELKDRIANLDNKATRDSMREYLNHRYIDYDTLCESRCFYPMSELGARLVPTIQNLDKEIKSYCEDMLNEVIENKPNNDYDI